MNTETRKPASPVEIVVTVAALKAALVVAPATDIRYYLNAVALIPGRDPAMTEMWATDGHCALGQALGAEAGPLTRQYLLPREAVKNAVKAAAKNTALVIVLEDQSTEENPHAGRVTFKTGGTEMSAKLVDGVYPDVHRVDAAANRDENIGPAIGSINANITSQAADIRKILGKSKNAEMVMFEQTWADYIKDGRLDNAAAQAKFLRAGGWQDVRSAGSWGFTAMPLRVNRDALQAVAEERARVVASPL